MALYGDAGADMTASQILMALVDKFAQTEKQAAELARKLKAIRAMYV